jgi:hypothetical protein
VLQTVVATATLLQLCCMITTINVSDRFILEVATICRIREHCIGNPHRLEFHKTLVPHETIENGPNSLE